jgi:hypothetical protein
LPVREGVEKQRTVLEINRGAAEAAGLKFNSRLLKLARKVLNSGGAQCLFFADVP